MGSRNSQGKLENTPEYRINQLRNQMYLFAKQYQQVTGPVKDQGLSTSFNDLGKALSDLTDSYNVTLKELHQLNYQKADTEMQFKRKSVELDHTKERLRQADVELIDLTLNRDNLYTHSDAQSQKFYQAQYEIRDLKESLNHLTRVSGEVNEEYQNYRKFCLDMAIRLEKIMTSMRNDPLCDGKFIAAIRDVLIDYEKELEGPADIKPVATGEDGLHAAGEPMPNTVGCAATGPDGECYMTASISPEGVRAILDAE